MNNKCIIQLKKNNLIICFSNTYLLENIPFYINILTIETYRYKKNLIENLPDNIEQLNIFYYNINCLYNLPSSLKILNLNYKNNINLKNINLKKLPKLLEIIEIDFLINVKKIPKSCIFLDDYLQYRNEHKYLNKS